MNESQGFRASRSRSLRTQICVTLYQGTLEAKIWVDSYDSKEHMPTDIVRQKGMYLGKRWTLMPIVAKNLPRLVSIGHAYINTVIND